MCEPGARGPLPTWFGFAHLTSAQSGGIRQAAAASQRPCKPTEGSKETTMFMLREQILVHTRVCVVDSRCEGYSFRSPRPQGGRSSFSVFRASILEKTEKHPTEAGGYCNLLPRFRKTLCVFICQNVYVALKRNSGKFRLIRILKQACPVLNPHFDTSQLRDVGQVI